MDKFYEKVKEGGYDFERLGSPKTVGDRDRALLLDPQAWIALGKAEGWLDGVIELPWKMHLRYMKEWHRFIDHLATGGTPDDFFDSLLK